MNDSIQTIHFDFIPEAGADEKLESYWQNECKKLQRSIVKKLDELDEVELNAAIRPPQPGEEGDATRSLGGGLFDFASLILSLKSPEVVERVGGVLWDSLNSWFSRRSECSAVIKIGGGEFNFKNLTKEELIDLMQRHENALS